MKYFTPAEAENTLPLVKKIVADILQAGQTARQLISENAPLNQIALKEIEKQLHELFSELELIGCDYKDWNYEIGLVDFPAMIDNRQVCLCWKSDEPKLMYYHGIHEGFAGRKLIPQELLTNYA
jgi:hypothetical protein